MISGKTVQLGYLEGIVDSGNELSMRIDSEPIPIKASLNVITNMSAYIRDGRVIVEANSIDPEIDEFGFVINEEGRLIYSYDTDDKPEFDVLDGHLRVLSIEESPVMEYINGSLQINKSISAELNLESCVSATINTYTGDSDPYTGDYIVEPAVDDQTLNTKEKHMVDNVIVKAIPYFETSNEYGITIVIGE